MFTLGKKRIESIIAQKTTNKNICWETHVQIQIMSTAKFKRNIHEGSGFFYYYLFKDTEKGWNESEADK